MSLTPQHIHWPKSILGTEENKNSRYFPFTLARQHGTVGSASYTAENRITATIDEIKIQ